ncbi:hypothetical protein NECID01_0653 [Nematocida sp. AWRm77]|nr:hypothetical protein NECID01_0653 [Nematocida sp. AWRm77]
MLCLKTEEYLSFERELVSSFLSRNNLSLTTHAVVKVVLHKDTYMALETLELGSYLEPACSSEHFYFLTEPEVSVDVCLNPYTKQMLRTEESRLSFFCAKHLSVSSIWTLLFRMFSASLKIKYFALYCTEDSAYGYSLKKAPLYQKLRAGSVFYLQAEEPFVLAQTEPPIFSSSFLQLRSFNSPYLFAKSYKIDVFGHFLCATKSTRKNMPEHSLEITEDLRAYKQVVGTRVFAVVEQNGVRWSLHHKNPNEVEELLRAIAHAPRHKPRLVTSSEKETWKKKCSALNGVLGKTFSNSSLHKVLTLFPSEMPNSYQISHQEPPEVLIQKLAAHLQRSIWDNVTIEFIAYLLTLQNVPLSFELHREIRAFSVGRKKILAQLKQMGQDNENENDNKNQG